MNNVLKPLAEITLISLGLTAAESATYAAILEKIFYSSKTPLIISNEELDDIMKILNFSMNLVY